MLKMLTYFFNSLEAYRIIVNRPDILRFAPQIEYQILQYTQSKSMHARVLKFCSLMTHGILKRRVNTEVQPRLKVLPS